MGSTWENLFSDEAALVKALYAQIRPARQLCRWGVVSRLFFCGWQQEDLRTSKSSSWRWREAMEPAEGCGVARTRLPTSTIHLPRSGMGHDAPGAEGVRAGSSASPVAGWLRTDHWQSL